VSRHAREESVADIPPGILMRLIGSLLALNGMCPGMLELERSVEPHYFQYQLQSSSKCLLSVTVCLLGTEGWHFISVPSNVLQSNLIMYSVIWLISSHH
jgi:hypothetical protein